MFKITRNTRLVLLTLLTLHVPVTHAQSAAPTTGIFTRVLMVKSQYGSGSIFSIDVDNREYWITAKHILTGAEHPPYGSISKKSVSLRLLNPSVPGRQWILVNFSIIDPGKDIDIVALAATEPVLKNPVPSPVANTVGVMFGGDCEFLGFPYGEGWRTTFVSGQSLWMPFVKHCTISAMTTDMASRTEVFYLDGINNGGFSGGPVIYRTGPSQQIIAVVSGYITEPVEVVSSHRSKLHTPPPSGEIVNVNSGFMLAYSIKSVIDAIHKNPIGPLRQPD